jgi:hypothetical protein
MDFEWFKGVICQTWEGWLSIMWFWTWNFEHTNREREELLVCRRRAPRVQFIGEAGWPGPTGLGGLVLPLARLSSSVMISPLWLSCQRAALVAPLKLSHPLLCLYYWSFHLMPLLWVCPCSLVSHATMNFLYSNACYPHMLVLCMWYWWKLLKGHPMMHHGACMICLTRLPPSKHVLRLSTPIILKI